MDALSTREEELAAIECLGSLEHQTEDELESISEESEEERMDVESEGEGIELDAVAQEILLLTNSAPSSSAPSSTAIASPTHVSNRTQSNNKNIYRENRKRQRKEGLRWTEEEDRLLLETVKEHEDKDQRYHRVLRPSINKGPWSKEEVELLLNAIECFGDTHRISWSQVAKKVTGRTDIQCRYQYMKLVRDKKLKALLKGVHSSRQRKMKKNKDKKDKDAMSAGEEEFELEAGAVVSKRKESKKNDGMDAGTEVFFIKSDKMPLDSRLSACLNIL